jgi:hypothetical protein
VDLVTGSTKFFPGHAPSATQSKSQSIPHRSHKPLSNFARKSSVAFVSKAEKDRLILQVATGRSSRASTQLYVVGPQLSSWTFSAAALASAEHDLTSPEAADALPSRAVVCAAACTDMETVLLLEDGRLVVQPQDVWVQESKQPSSRFALLQLARRSSGPPRRKLAEALELGAVHIPHPVDALRTTYAEWFWSRSRKMGGVHVDRFPRWLSVAQLSCGSSHIACITDVAGGRQLYTWGQNSKGQLGLGADVEVRGAAARSAG